MGEARYILLATLNFTGDNMSSATPIYADITTRMHGIDGADCRIVGDATGHPMWGLTLGTKDPNRKQVLLTAGIHGDEPAGVEAALQFLEGFGNEFLDRFTFTVIPCANPSGFEAGTRVNASGQDINRSMSDDSVPESVTLRRSVADTHFDIFFDLHEDYEATGYYMYEIQRQNQLLGAQIVEAVRQIGAIDGSENTDEGLDMPISDGLFAINPAWRQQGWSAWAYYEAADHAVLTETPSTAWPLKQRVAAHHVALRLVLEHYGV